MLTANQQKFINALHVKKYRQKYRKFIVEGGKMAAELLAQQRIQPYATYGLESWAAAYPTLLAPLADRFTSVSEAELKKISTLTTPNQVLIVADLPDQDLDPADLLTGYHFYLDGIQDPGNLGAILRVADWFGFNPLFCSPDCVDAYSPKVVQAGMGAFLRIQTFETDLESLLGKTPDLPVLGAVLDGEPAFQATLPPRGLMVIGNEGRGISHGVMARLTQRLTIPRATGGGAESLNAAVAAGILAAALRNHRGRN